MADENKRDDSPAVLTDPGKWWEFLDSETYAVKPGLPGAQRVTSDMLDWKALSATQRRAPLGFGYFNRCDSCGQAAPPDLTFCVHCGGRPISPQPIRRFSLVIKEIPDAGVRDAVAEWLTRSGHDLKLAEVTKMLGALPAVFNLDVRKDRAAAIVARLADLGVGARAFPVEDVSSLMVRETAETIVREPTQWAVYGAIVLGTLGLFWVWGPLALVGVGALFWQFNARREWYGGRYRLDDELLLNQVAGFDAHVAQQAADELRRAHDKEIRKAFSLCLMEYYALNLLMRAEHDQYGAVLTAPQRALRELLEQVVETMARFGEIQRALEAHEPARLRARLAEVEQRLQQVTDPRTRVLLEEELGHLEVQRAQHERLSGLRESFLSRMQAMGDSLEALRRRLAQAQALRQSLEVRMEDVLKELDDELDIFEQTFAELEPAVHVSGAR